MLSNTAVSIIYTLTSVCIFSILFSIHFLICWPGEFVWKSRLVLVYDHLFCSHDLNIWLRSDTARRNRMLVTPWKFNPLTPKITLLILLTVCHTVLVMLVWRIWVGSINSSLINVFLDSHYLPAWYCIDIVRRNSVLVTHGSYMVDEVVSLYSFTALQYKHYLTLNLHFFLTL